MTPSPAVAVRDLTKTFPSRSGEVRAVDNLSLTLEPGQVVAFLGPNGAGKTTTLDMLLGLTQPTAGSIEVFGHRPHDAIQRGLVGATLQDGTLGPGLTVRQTLTVLASLHTHPLPLEELLERAELTALASRKVAALSGGERQRLRLAAALLPDPRLLVLDEPTTGMDVTARAAFWNTMHALAATGERTLLFATHYLEEAAAFADRIVIMSRGRLVADGTLADLRAAHEVTTVTASWPSPDDAAARAALAAHLRPVAGSIEEWRLDGGTLTIRTRDSDAVARLLLTGSPATDLTITPVSLDTLFTQIVED